MKKARMIGNYAQHNAQEMGLSTDDISKVLDFSNRETISFFKGRLMLTYEQLSELAKILHITVQDILHGDEEIYAASVVHCMNDFDDEANREKILDLIDDYMDVRDSLLKTH